MNEEEFEFLGITKFHKAGYTGKNVTVASKESILINIFDDVECDDYYKSRSDSAKHGTNVMDIIRQTVPDARKIATDMSSVTKNKVWKCPGFEKLLADPPTVFTGSAYNSATSKEPQMIKYRELKDKGCLMVFSAGNEDEKGTNAVVKDDTFKAIAAYKLSKGKPKREYFSSIGPEVDYASLDNLKVTWTNGRKTGTSFSAPLFAGMAALVQDFFITKTGKQLTVDKLLQFIEDNCIDVEETGKDTKSGFGLFILPDPATIDIKKYAEVQAEQTETQPSESEDYVSLLKGLGLTEEELPRDEEVVKILINILRKLKVL